MAIGIFCWRAGLRGEANQVKNSEKRYTDRTKVGRMRRVASFGFQEDCKVRRMQRSFATEIKEDTENPLFSALCVLCDLCGLLIELFVFRLCSSSDLASMGKQANGKAVF